MARNNIFFVIGGVLLVLGSLLIILNLLGGGTASNSFGLTSRNFECQTTVKNPFGDMFIESVVCFRGEKCTKIPGLSIFDSIRQDEGFVVMEAGGKRDVKEAVIPELNSRIITTRICTDVDSGSVELFDDKKQKLDGRDVTALT